MKISNLAKHYPISGIRVMKKLGKQVPNCIDLCSGDPDFDTPPHITHAACRALQEGLTHYAPGEGSDRYRRAAADKCSRQFGTKYINHNICACLGAVQGVMMSLMAVVDPGDEVLLPDPGYTCYEGQVRCCGGVAVRLPLKKEQNFLPDPNTLQRLITPKTRAIVLNYPHNPSGAVLTKEAFDPVAEIIKKHGLYVISDEVYEAFVYTESGHYSPIQNPNICDRVLSVHSLSKTYAMTGWRVGYVLAHEDLICQVAKMQEAMAACLPTFVMEAAAQALSGPQQDVEKMKEIYRHHRQLLHNALSPLPNIDLFVPDGGFCALADISASGLDDKALAKRLLFESGVLTCPGSVFGVQGANYLRLCFARNTRDIESAAKKMVQFFSCL